MQSLKRLSGGITALSLLLGIAGSFGVATPYARAATSPSLGTAADYSILAGSNVTNTGATSISENVGISPGDGAPGTTGFGTVTFTSGGVVHDADAAALTAQGDRDAAVLALAIPACGADGGIDYGAVTHTLDGETLPPGVYCATSFHLNGTLTLSGTSTDVWIFRSASDLIITTAAAEVVFSGTGLACNVWWTAVSSATFDAGSAFIGNVLAETSITFAAGASLDGRALASTAEVTMDSTSITGPTCTAAPTVASPDFNTITVIKNVVNDNGGTAVFEDFPLFINGNRVNSGQSVSLASGTYTVSETNLSTYTAVFSGDCNANGVVNHSVGGNKICIITNNDIGAPVVAPPVPPLIDIVKIPTPLALPDGPGPVTYEYTVRNIGTVPMTDVTVIDDSCTPTLFILGDLDTDATLDVTETWTYRCSTNLSATHTNTVVATGWANGLSAVDVAEATVVVGVPLIPPLIHVTKVPSPLALLAGGGFVTYTEVVSNPGTVPLNNVTLVDDTCSPMAYISGDDNGDGLLDPSEAWTYTCRSNLTATTTNTAVATGTANGFTVRDLAVATVVVAAASVVPLLPNTGIAPAAGLMGAGIVVAGALWLGAFVFFARNRKHSSR